MENLLRLGIGNEVKILSTTLTDFRSVLTSLDTAEPDEIYSLAGQSSVSFSFEEPVEPMHSITGMAPEYVQAMWLMLQQPEPGRLCNCDRRKSLFAGIRGSGLRSG
jgi:GDP-D-mannose dehydratase